MSERMEYGMKVKITSSFCGASILRLPRGIVNSSGHRVMHAIKRIFWEGGVKMLWSSVISQLSLSNSMMEPNSKCTFPVTFMNYRFMIFLLVDAVLIIILMLKY